MINSSLVVINNLLKTEIEKLCRNYEEKIEVLEAANQKLENSLTDAQQKILLLETAINNLKEKNKIDDLNISEKSNQFNVRKKEIIDNSKNINKISVKDFNEYINRLNSALLNSNNKFIIRDILKEYNEIKSDKKINLLKNSFIYNGHAATEQLLSNPLCFVEKIQFLSTLKLVVNYQKKYVHKLLTTFAPGLKNTLTEKELAYLFWYAYLFDYETLFMEQFKNLSNWSAQKNPLTSIYFEQINKEDFFIFEAKLNQLLIDLKIFNNSDIGILKRKLLKKVSNVIETTNSNMESPLINKVYVIKEIDRFKFLDAFDLKQSTITVNFTNQSKNKSIHQDTIQAWVDWNSNKAYIFEKELATYKKKFSPLHLRISGYPDFKWPTTEISKSSETDRNTILQQKSILTSLGYHYELDKSKRWDILCKAVNQYTLKKVAYTLANNTKRLKGRKSDSLAIKIWESDLNRLKESFYTNQFNWPITTI